MNSLYHKITTDEEALVLIEMLLEFKFCDEDESSRILRSLENYVSGIADIITQENTMLPEEILKKARERNKPILL